MRMRIVVGHFSVRSPAGVADSVATGSGLFGHQFREGGDPSRTLAGLDVIMIDNRHTGRVVAAILEASQPIEQDRRRLRTTDVTDDSAHDFECSGGSP